MGSKATYETFESGKAVNIADKGDGNYASEDSGAPKNEVEHGAVPTMPQSK